MAERRAVAERSRATISLDRQRASGRWHRGRGSGFLRLRRDCAFAAGGCCFRVAVFAVLVVVHARVVERLERAQPRRRILPSAAWRGWKINGSATGEAGERFRNPSHVYEKTWTCSAKARYSSCCAPLERAPARIHWLAGCWRRQSREEVARAAAGHRRTAVPSGSARGSGRARRHVRSGMDPEAAARWGEAPQVQFPAGAPFIAAAARGGRGRHLRPLHGGRGHPDALSGRIARRAGLRIFSRQPDLASRCAVDSPAHDLVLLGEAAAAPGERTSKRRCSSACETQLAASGLVASFQIGRLQRLVARLDWQRKQRFRAHRHRAAVERAGRHGDRAMAQALGPHIREWIGAAGEFEALVSLAGYSYEHPAR